MARRAQAEVRERLQQLRRGAHWPVPEMLPASKEIRMKRFFLLLRDLRIFQGSRTQAIRLLLGKEAE